MNVTFPHLCFSLRNKKYIIFIWLKKKNILSKAMEQFVVEITLCKGCMFI